VLLELHGEDIDEEILEKFGDLDVRDVRVDRGDCDTGWFCVWTRALGEKSTFL
jgi:hypothetical protein